MRRKRVAALASITATLTAFVGGWVAARETESPAQRAANAQPPALGPLFFDVRTGGLEDSVSGTGSITYISTTNIVPASGASGVVTRQIRAKGDEIASPSPILEVNGLPLFVLHSPFPFYRDLRPGLRGSDVSVLQENLRILGAHIPDEERSIFGHATGVAVQQMFTRAGYPPTDRLARDELCSVPNFPVSVQSLSAIGDKPSNGTFGKLGSGSIVAAITLDSASYVRLQRDLPVSLSVGSVASVGGKVASLEVIENRPEAIVRPDRALPLHDLGARTVATFTIEVVAKAALLVPERAIATGADGAHQLIRRRTNAPDTSVLVHVIGVLNGVAAVEPQTAGDLLDNDQVEIDR